MPKPHSNVEEAAPDTGLRSADTRAGRYLGVVEERQRPAEGIVTTAIGCAKHAKEQRFGSARHGASRAGSLRADRNRFPTEVACSGTYLGIRTDEVVVELSRIEQHLEERVPRVVHGTRCAFEVRRLVLLHGDAASDARVYLEPLM